MVRTYGHPPFRAALLHGGPGAPGTLSPVARRLSVHGGVLEPLQSARSVDGLIEELHAQLLPYAAAPLVWIGHSWGAWLALLAAARYPDGPRRLVLVDAGPLTDGYAPQLLRRRLDNLSPEDRGLLRRLLAALSSENAARRETAMQALPALLKKADCVFWDPDPVQPGDQLPADSDAYGSVWPQAAALRTQGALIKAAQAVRCPIDVIHGAQDPHPVEGVTEPLERAGVSYTLHLLPRCGHDPFEEAHAKAAFLHCLVSSLQ